MLFGEDRSFWQRTGIPDFTLEFEESVLQLLPSGSFILFASALVFYYYHNLVRIVQSKLLWVKVCVSLGLILLECIGLALRCLSSDRTDITLAAASLDLAATIAIAAVVYVEHRHAIRTSAVLGLYLAVGILIDGTKTHSYFVRNLVASGVVAAVTAATRLVLLVLEEVPKTSLIIDPETRGRSGGETTSGFFTRTLFLFLQPMMSIGYRETLTMDDLGILGPEFSSERLYSTLSRHWPAVKHPKKHSLFKACCMAWKWALLAIILPRLCVTGLSFSQPFVMYAIIGSVEDAPEAEEERGGLVLATTFAFVGASICRAVTTHAKNRVVTRLRGGLLSQMSAKSYRLKLSDAKKQAAITLMSADFESIVTGFPDLIEIPFSLIDSGLGMYFLAHFIKEISLIILIPLITTTIMGILFGRHLAPAMRVWNQSIEARVAKTSRVLSQLPAIKSLGLGPQISEYIQYLRIIETAASRRFRIIQSLSLGTGITVDTMTPVLVIAAALFTKAFAPKIVADIVFPILGIVSLVQEPLAKLVKMYPSAMAMLGCFERIQEFLCQDEYSDPRIPCDNGIAQDSITHGWKGPSAQGISQNLVILRFSNASIAPPGVEDPLLTGVDFSISEGSVVAMFGPTSSGKTILSQSLLGETDILDGELYMDRRITSIAVCGQMVWLCNATIRDCIIGACAYNAALFNMVVAYCKLAEDLEQLSGGDLYVIGSDGLGLSGGQRQRIGIARAVYTIFFGTKVIVFDDIFGSLDRQTALEILNGLCGKEGLLRQWNCTVVLSSYMRECLDVADSLLLLDGNGHVSCESCEENGKVRKEVDELLRGGFLGDGGKPSPTAAANTGGNATHSASGPGTGVQRVQDPCRRGDAKLYLLWVNAIGRISLSLWMFLVLLMSIAESFPPIYMRIWIELFPANTLYIIGYALISAFAGVLAAATLLVLFLRLAPRGSNRLHEQLTNAVTRATIGFLSTTDSGSLLNRYSQDMELLSKRLPVAVFATLYCLFTTSVQLGAILSGATYMTAILPFIIFAIYFIQRYYLRTSRQLRLLEIETQAPLVKELKESATGLVYIRSFHCQQFCLSRFLQRLDQSQRPFYFLLCAQALLALVLDLLASSVGIVLAIISLYAKNSSSKNAAGLAFLNLISLGTSFNRTVMQWTLMETSIGSLSRLRDFLNDTPTETKKRTTDLPENWPNAGRVELRNVDARYKVDYRDQQSSVLHNICLQIPPGRKIGIMGRTGSGKSSLLYSLLGFLEYEGKIEIDGVDISTVDPDLLRSRIITITQDVVELDGTVRDNLLPFEKSWNTKPPTLDEKAKAEYERKNTIVRETLVHLGVWDKVKPKGGLQAPLESVGFSQGEKQLFCIARAVVRRRLTGSRLMLVDEATANVDYWKDQIVREMMVEYFRGCTIIVVAHREETIADSNSTIHMSSGRISQIDNYGG